MIETNGGATTSFGYRVIVARRGWYWRTGTEVASLHPAARSNRAYGVNLVWQNDHNLAVEFLRADHEDLSVPLVTVAGRQVTTTLQWGIEDPEAPAGGMLYNLQHRPRDHRPLQGGMTIKNN